MNVGLIDQEQRKKFFPEIIHDHGLSNSGGIAFAQGDQTVTWREFARRSSQIANRLRKLGSGKGDRIAIMGRNSIAYSEVMAGVLTAGTAVVPLPTLVSIDTIQLILLDSCPRHLFLDQQYLETVSEVLQSKELQSEIELIGLDFDNETVMSYDCWCQDASDSWPDVAIEAGDIFGILYSSGTTGVPKGILLDHGVRLDQAATMSSAGFDQNAVNVISTPLYTYGALSAWMPTIFGGGCNVLMEKFDAFAFLSLIEKHCATHAMLVPAQYDRIMRESEFDSFDISSMQYWFGGSAPMSVGLKEEIVGRLPGEIFEFYSLTEGGVTTAFLPKYFPDKLASVGQPANGCVIKILDEKGNELPVGATGEVVGRSPIKMAGYLNREDLNRDIIWKDDEGFEYIRSGDNGRLDEDGFLYLGDRKKDMIISGGQNVYAADIEAILQEHSNIHEVAVIGVPSKKWGESPLAIVTLEKGADVDIDELKVWVNSRLGKTQRISAIEVWPELPKNHLGKVRKNVLRQTFADQKRIID